MGLCLVRSRALLGLEARPVCVEVHLANGLPSFTNVMSQVDGPDRWLVLDPVRPRTALVPEVEGNATH